MNKIVGKLAGCYSPLGRTMILQDENGNELSTGVIVEQEVVFDATDNDVRSGLIYANNEGKSVGTKIIPAYHTTEGYRVITVGSDFTILFTDDLFDFTKLQALICPANTSISDSVATEKVAINNEVYEVNSTEIIATVTKDVENKQINLEIINNSNKPYVLRYFTYKEIY